MQHDLWVLMQSVSGADPGTPGDDPVSAAAIAFIRDHGSALAVILDRYPDMDIAVGQAVGLATFITGATEGTLAQCAQHYLSLPYSTYIANRLKGELT